MASTKSGAPRQTYAQNSCHGAPLPRMRPAPRYQSHSTAKLLIYIETLKCFFSGHSKESLDLQGLATIAGELSTKLSTEIWEIFKTVSNQRLSALCGCNFEEIPRNG
jgi:hypothetical protein